MQKQRNRADAKKWALTILVLLMAVVAVGGVLYIISGGPGNGTPVPEEVTESAEGENATVDPANTTVEEVTLPSAEATDESGSTTADPAYEEGQVEEVVGTLSGVSEEK